VAWKTRDLPRDGKRENGAGQRDDPRRENGLSVLLLGSEGAIPAAISGRPRRRRGIGVWRPGEVFDLHRRPERVGELAERAKPDWERGRTSCLRAEIFADGGCAKRRA